MASAAWSARTRASAPTRSRRGWDMTHLLPEFRPALPSGLQLDGEIVALNPEGRPDFHRLSSRLLHGRTGVPVLLFVFDLLAAEGLATTMLSYAERRALLEQLDVETAEVRVVTTTGPPTDALPHGRLRSASKRSARTEAARVSTGTCSPTRWSGRGPRSTPTWATSRRRTFALSQVEPQEFVDMAATLAPARPFSVDISLNEKLLVADFGRFNDHRSLTWCSEVPYLRRHNGMTRLAHLATNVNFAGHRAPPLRHPANLTLTDQP